VAAKKNRQHQNNQKGKREKKAASRADIENIVEDACDSGNGEEHHQAKMK